MTVQAAYSSQKSASSHQTTRHYIPEYSTLHSHLQIVTTSNYNALANSCIRLLTTANTKSSQFVFTSRFLVTDPNNVLCLFPYRLVNISQLPRWRPSRTNFLLFWLIELNSLKLLTCMPIISRRGPLRKYRLSLLWFNRFCGNMFLYEAVT
jgi:hypothetical protein